MELALIRKAIQIGSVGYSPASFFELTSLTKNVQQTQDTVVPIDSSFFSEIHESKRLGSKNDLGDVVTAIYDSARISAKTHLDIENTLFLRRTEYEKSLNQSKLDGLIQFEQRLKAIMTSTTDNIDGLADSKSAIANFNVQTQILEEQKVQNKNITELLNTNVRSYEYLKRDAGLNPIKLVLNAFNKYSSIRDASARKNLTTNFKDDTFSDFSRINTIDKFINRITTGIFGGRIDTFKRHKVFGNLSKTVGNKYDTGEKSEIALTSVIPTLLSDILSAVSGKSAKYYDWEAGKKGAFSSKTDIVDRNQELQRQQENKLNTMAKKSSGLFGLGFSFLGANKEKFKEAETGKEKLERERAKGYMSGANSSLSGAIGDIIGIEKADRELQQQLFMNNFGKIFKYVTPEHAKKIFSKTESFDGAVAIIKRLEIEAIEADASLNSYEKFSSRMKVDTAEVANLNDINLSTKDMSEYEFIKKQLDTTNNPLIIRKLIYFINQQKAFTLNNAGGILTRWTTTHSEWKKLGEYAEKRLEEVIIANGKAEAEQLMQETPLNLEYERGNKQKPTNEIDYNEEKSSLISADIMRKDLDIVKTSLGSIDDNTKEFSSYVNKVNTATNNSLIASEITEEREIKHNTRKAQKAQILLPTKLDKLIAINTKFLKKKINVKVKDSKNSLDLLGMLKNFGKKILGLGGLGAAGLGAAAGGIGAGLGIVMGKLAKTIGKLTSGIGGLARTLGDFSLKLATSIGALAKKLGLGALTLAKTAGVKIIQGAKGLWKGASKGVKSLLGKLGKGGRLASKIVTKNGVKYLVGGAGKVLLPLTAALALYDGYNGYNADPTAEGFEKFVNSGSAVVNGITFGLIGKTADEIQIDAANKAKGIYPTTVHSEEYNGSEQTTTNFSSTFTDRIKSDVVEVGDKAENQLINNTQRMVREQQLTNKILSDFVISNNTNTENSINEFETYNSSYSTKGSTNILKNSSANDKQINRYFKGLDGVQGKTTIEQTIRAIYSDPETVNRILNRLMSYGINSNLSLRQLWGSGDENLNIFKQILSMNSNNSSMYDNINSTNNSNNYNSNGFRNNNTNYKNSNVNSSYKDNNVDMYNTNQTNNNLVNTNTPNSSSRNASNTSSTLDKQINNYFNGLNGIQSTTTIEQTIRAIYSDSVSVNKILNKLTSRGIDNNLTLSQLWRSEDNSLDIFKHIISLNTSSSNNMYNNNNNYVQDNRSSTSVGTDNTNSVTSYDVSPGVMQIATY